MASSHDDAWNVVKIMILLRSICSLWMKFCVMTMPPKHQLRAIQTLRPQRLVALCLVMISLKKPGDLHCAGTTHSNLYRREIIADMDNKLHLWEHAYTVEWTKAIWMNWDMFCRPKTSRWQASHQPSNDDCHLLCQSVYVASQILV